MARKKNGSKSPKENTSKAKKDQGTVRKSPVTAGRNRDIAYQNKDITSKITGEAMVGRSLSPFGLPHIKVKGILPTNLPVIEANELRLDNLFVLEDEAVAIFDYESHYSRENFVKYINYAARVTKRYADQNRLDELKSLRIIVIYTADVKRAREVYDLDGIRVKVESAYLIGLDTEAIYRKLEAEILWKDRGRAKSGEKREAEEKAS